MLPVQDEWRPIWAIDMYSDKLWYRAKVIALYQQRVDERASGERTTGERASGRNDRRTGERKE